MRSLLPKLKLLEFLAIYIVGITLLFTDFYILGIILSLLGLTILIWRKSYFLLTTIIILTTIIFFNIMILHKSSNVILEKTTISKCELNMCVAINNGEKYFLNNKFNLTEKDEIIGNFLIKDMDNNFAYSKGIFKEIIPIKINNINVKNSIREWIFKIMENNPSKSFLKWMIFGQSSSDIIDLKNKFIDMGIIHLVVISGFHIGIIFKILQWVTKKNYWLSIGITFLYIILLQFSISSLRGFSLLLFGALNKKYKWNLESIQLLSILLIIFLVISPQLILSMSFLLSFSITYWVMKFQSIKINNWKNNLFNLLMIYISTIPWTISINEKINIISFFYTIIFTPIIAFIYVFCLFTFFIGFFIKIHLFLEFLIEKISLLSKLNTYIPITGNIVLFSTVWVLLLWLISINKKLSIYFIPVFGIIIWLMCY